MRVVFFGMNSEYSILPMLALLEDCNLVGAFDLKPKPSGREKLKTWVKKVLGYKSTGAYSIEKIAATFSVNYYSADNIDTAYFNSWLIDLKPDLICVAGFSKKIPPSILSIPTLGTINIHTGPLPLYRGAFPFFALIKKDNRMGGVSIHWMNENFDDGEILAVVDVPLLRGMNLSVYNTICGYKAALELKKILTKLKHNEIIEKKQVSINSFLNCRYPKVGDRLINEQLTVEEALWYFTAFSDSMSFHVVLHGKIKKIYRLSKITFRGSEEINLKNGVVYIA